jgi:hypothetical protein
MKTQTLKNIILLTICCAAFVLSAYSQPAAGFSTYFYVNDPSSQTIINARVEAVRLFKNGKRVTYAKTDELKGNRYPLDFDYPALDECLKEDFLLKVTADGFKPAEATVNFSDGRTRAFEFVLAPEDSAESSKFFDLQPLIGNLKDEKGYGIADAKITLTAANGRKYEVTSDVGGMFSRYLPAGDYDVEIEYQGTKKSFGKKRVIAQESVNFYEAVLKRID